jgi:Gpi18-like mannosyltransferase
VFAQVLSVSENAERQPPLAGWRPALLWGFGIALAHRLLLGLWMALGWVMVGVDMLHLPMDYQPHGAAGLPMLETPFEQLALGLWRRWDARHYLTLALSGYQLNDPGSTVFGPLTPLGIHLLDIALPGPVDVAGLVFGILSFGLALTLLYRFCEVYHQDVELGRQAVILMALLPLSFFLSAPMSDAIYLAMVLGMFYAGVRNRWGLAALFGALATLARLQGIMLVGIAGLLLLESQSTSMSWSQRGIDVLKRGWWLILIPLSYIGFVVYRNSLGLPSLADTQARYSYIFLTNPFEGLWINLRWHFAHLSESLLNADFLSILVVSILLVVLFSQPRYRRLSLATYALSSALIFISKVNWEYGTGDVIATISFGRYALSLFPLVIVAADILRKLPRWSRLLIVSGLMVGLLLFSLQNALGVGPA